MLLQECKIFFFETHFAMMYLLILDVTNDSRNVGDANAKSAVTFLPREINALLTHPFRRIGLNQVDSLGQVYARGQINKNMSVISHATDDHRENVMVAAYSGHVGPNSGQHWFRNEFAALFRAKDDVEMVLGK
jgi:hypothetical protein